MSGKQWELGWAGVAEGCGTAPGVGGAGARGAEVQMEEHWMRVEALYDTTSISASAAKSTVGYHAWTTHSFLALPATKCSGDAGKADSLTVSWALTFGCLSQQ